MTQATTVHLCRHGQVENPTGILYGRLPGFHLSALGRQMADCLGEHFADVRIDHLRCSPLERAQETMAPIAAKHPELEVVIDERLIEAENHFAGSKVGLNRETLTRPANWWAFRNPLRPSWGEPYVKTAARMRAAMLEAAEAAGEGGTAVIVSHQLPIWLSRLAAEGRPFPHDPRRRQCTLASVTSFTVQDGHLTKVSYAEPCAALLPADKAQGQGRLSLFKAGA